MPVYFVLLLHFQGSGNKGLFVFQEQQDDGIYLSETMSHSVSVRETPKKEAAVTNIFTLFNLL